MPYLAAPTHELERSGKAFDQFVAPFVRPGAISLSDTADRLSRNPGLGPPANVTPGVQAKVVASPSPLPQSHRQRALPFRHGSHREDRPGHRRACHRCGDGFRRGLIVWPVASPPPQAELTKAPGTLGVASPAYLPVEGALHRQAFRTGRFMEAGSRRTAGRADGAESCGAAAGGSVSPSQVSLVTVGLPWWTSRHPVVGRCLRPGHHSALQRFQGGARQPCPRLPSGVCGLSQSPGAPYPRFAQGGEAPYGSPSSLARPGCAGRKAASVEGRKDDKN